MTNSPHWPLIPTDVTAIRHFCLSSRLRTALSSFLNLQPSHTHRSIWLLTNGQADPLLDSIILVATYSYILQPVQSRVTGYSHMTNSTIWLVPHDFRCQKLTALTPNVTRPYISQVNVEWKIRTDYEASGWVVQMCFTALTHSVPCTSIASICEFLGGYYTKTTYLEQL